MFDWLPWKVRRRRRERIARILRESGLYRPDREEGVPGAPAEDDRFERFVRDGWGGGFSPHPAFWTGFYRSQFSDSRALPRNPLAHYAETGWREGFWPNPVFDPLAYRESRRDVREGGREPLRHYLEYGWREGRPFHPRFSVEGYLVQFEETGVEEPPLIHFLREGWRAPARLPSRPDYRGWFETGCADLARWKLGEPARKETIGMEDWFAFLRRIEPKTPPGEDLPVVRFRVRTTGAAPAAVLRTMNSLSRQIRDNWTAEIEADPDSFGDESARARIIVARAPGRFRFRAPGVDVGEDDGRVLQVVLRAGEECAPHASAALGCRSIRGSVGAADHRAFLWEGTAPEPGGKGSVSTEAGEEVSGDWPKPGERGREYLRRRDPAYWSPRDFLAFLAREAEERDGGV